VRLSLSSCRAALPLAPIADSLPLSPSFFFFSCRGSPLHLRRPPLSRPRSRSGLGNSSTTRREDVGKSGRGAGAGRVGGVQQGRAVWDGRNASSASSFLFPSSETTAKEDGPGRPTFLAGDARNRVHASNPLSTRFSHRRPNPPVDLQDHLAVVLPSPEQLRQRATARTRRVEANSRRFSSSNGVAVPLLPTTEQDGAADDEWAVARLCARRRSRERVDGGGSGRRSSGGRRKETRSGRRSLGCARRRLFFLFQ
jgi:hypothetical protein